MMMHRTFALLAVVACGSMFAQADVASIIKAFQAQQSADRSIFAAAVVAQDATRILSENTAVSGSAKLATSTPFTVDTPVRMNGLGELFVSAAIMNLITLSFLPSLDAAIPTQYLPRGVSLVNPSFPTTALTLRMLLTHTSTITDVKFSSFGTTTPGSVFDLRSFAEGYFLTTSGGSFSVATDIFASLNPGSTGTYNPAKANTALLMFIVEQVVVTNPQLVVSTQKTFLAYVHEKFFAPLGMTNTFVLLSDGSFPTASYPVGSPLFAEAAVNDLTLQGSLATSNPLHPAYMLQAMAYTTVSDLAKFIRSMFVDARGSLRAIGTAMKSVSLSVRGQSSAAVAVTMQAAGVVYFDGTQLCASALATSAVTKCPFTVTSSIWGNIGTGSRSQVGFFCTDSLSATNPTCVTVAMAFFDSGATLKSGALAQALAGVTFQGAIGDTSSATQTSSTSSNSTASSLYGVWVFFGVLAVFVFTIVAAYFTEYVIQPAPATSGVVPPTTVMPQMVPDAGFDDRGY